MFRGIVGIIAVTHTVFRGVTVDHQRAVAAVGDGNRIVTAAAMHCRNRIISRGRNRQRLVARTQQQFNNFEVVIGDTTTVGH